MSDYGAPPPPPPPPPPPGGFQQPGYGQAAPYGAPLATWIQRVGAYLLDWVLTLPFTILQFIFPAIANNSGSSSLSALSALMSLLSLAVVVYNRWYLGGQGQSFGKKQLGLTLVAEATGQPIGMAKAFLRDLAHIIDAIICYIGFLFPLWDAKRQTIADKIMTTLVTTRP